MGRSLAVEVRDMDLGMLVPLVCPTARVPTKVWKVPAEFAFISEFHSISDKEGTSGGDRQFHGSVLGI